MVDAKYPVVGAALDFRLDMIGQCRDRVIDGMEALGDHQQWNGPAQRFAQAIDRPGDACRSHPQNDEVGVTANRSAEIPIVKRLDRRQRYLEPRVPAGAFHAAGSARGGSGVITLPCGAGKTIVGMACMATLQSSTLILTTSVTAVRQWIRELLDKTTLVEEQIASGLRRQGVGFRSPVIPQQPAGCPVSDGYDNRQQPHPTQHATESFHDVVSPTIVS